MLAFSLWDAIWIVFVSFLFINVLMLFFAAVSDLVRDRELSGWAKAGWIVALILFPLLGILVYFVARGPQMADRAARDQAKAQESFDSYVRDVAGGPASELEKAAALHSDGKLSDDEFAALKARILA